MKISRRITAVLLAAALLLCAVPALFASAATVIPRAVQIQWRDEWKDDYYGTTYRGNLYDTGCGIFSTVNAVGYLTGNEMSITEVAQFAYDSKALNYYAGGVDRTILYPKIEAQFGEDYGFKVINTGTWSKVDDTLKNHLLGGGVAIGHVYGHFIAVVGYNATTKQFHIYDSAPSTARGTGNGDAWVTEAWLTTSTYLTLDWYCLLTRTGTVINRDYGETGDTTSGTTAAKLGTYRINTATLNVRAGASTSYDIVTTVKQDTLVKVTELADNGWGKFVAPDGVEGWANVTYYGEYVGVDGLAYETVSMNDVVKVSRGTNGSLSLINDAGGMGIVDLMLPHKLGTLTTPHMNIEVVPVSGNGFYFGLTQYASGYFMMRDCQSGDQLVNELSAPYMTNMETLDIDLSVWWDTTDTYQVDMVRFYIAPRSTVRINYCYFTAEANRVNDTSYNLVKGNPNVTLMKPDTLAIVGDTKKGSYRYDRGTLTVTADTAEGFDVVFNVNETVNVNTLKKLLLDVNTAVPFNVTLELTHANGDGVLTLADDYYTSFTDTFPSSGYLPAYTGTAALDFYSYYNYNGVLPADGMSVVKAVKISLGGKGSATFHAIQLSSTDQLTDMTDDITKSDSCEGKTVVNGDVNGDGVVSTVDARMIITHLIGGVKLSDEELAVADHDGNGAVNTTDVRSILSSVLV